MQMSSQTSSPGVKQKVSEGQSLILTRYWNIPETTGEKIRFQTFFFFFFFPLGSSFNNASSHDLSGFVEKILWKRFCGIRLSVWSNRRLLLTPGARSLRLPHTHHSQNKINQTASAYGFSHHSTSFN